MNRAYYSDTIISFLDSPNELIVGTLASANEFALEQTQRDAWTEEISILKEVLKGFNGKIYFEFSIPRMGKRIDVLLLINHIIFVLEFKTQGKEYNSNAIEQVWDYALDLKNFHETSHNKLIVPILIATKAKDSLSVFSLTADEDKIVTPISCSVGQLHNLIIKALEFADGETINHFDWEGGRYSPTPTIIEAALALYKGHSVAEISRKDASANKLNITTNAISDLISYSKQNSRKSICFVTGVPGAGKTLVGLKIATQHNDPSNELHSVFLSGNDPLVKILCAALAMDKYDNDKKKGKKTTRKEALHTVKAFIQNVHHFRDECLKDENRPPIEHVTLFDEAQRAWNIKQTSSFMTRKKNKPDFNRSESEFLISCLNRHEDWAVIVCLVGGGQEINTGEAGINEWIESIIKSYRDWDVYISPNLLDEEYISEKIVKDLQSHSNVFYKPELHLAVSMRSFRAEHVSRFIKNTLDLKVEEAKETLTKIKIKYPIVITRDLDKAKKWLKTKARGSERYGIVVSSQAERLKPLAIDVRSDMDPVNWFLKPKEDVRSSFYLEDVATEFDVQGLELDWVCVTWDADFRYTPNGWIHKSFRGSYWTNIKSEERKNYLKNAYRVLLTRARQGMVIVVPSGDPEDPTRDPAFYNDTYEYLKEIGLPVI
ncbi:MAG TPA: DUF2075 domain-containing protein [Bacteroidia bacterium]|jgi:hypothetical protein|nr:DUF2075 domain-containing protein [Bacteroidia bacterium]